MSKLKNSLFKDITSINSKNFHIALRGCDNSRVENVNIDAPGNSINTDGIHIAKLNGLNITNSKIGTGDDCISFGEGSRNVHIKREWRVDRDMGSVLEVWANSQMKNQ